MSGCLSLWLWLAWLLGWWATMWSGATARSLLTDFSSGTKNRDNDHSRWNGSVVPGIIDRDWVDWCLLEQETPHPSLRWQPPWFFSMMTEGCTFLTIRNLCFYWKLGIRHFMLVFCGIWHFMVVFMGSDPSWMISSADFNDRIWLFFPPHYGCTHICEYNHKMAIVPHHAYFLRSLHHLVILSAVSLLPSISIQKNWVVWEVSYVGLFPFLWADEK